MVIKIIIINFLLYCFFGKSLDNKKINKNFLNAHNNYRRQHSAPDLVLDEKLIKYAQEHSDYLANKDDDSEEWGKDRTYLDGEYGQNIYTCYSTFKDDPCFNIDGVKPVEEWYNEITSYNFSDPGFTIGALHFTQLVWKSTKMLGCGVSVRNDELTYKVVCNYYPAINSLNNTEFIKNVFEKTVVNSSDFIYKNTKCYILLILILILL